MQTLQSNSLISKSTPKKGDNTELPTAATFGLFTKCSDLELVDTQLLVSSSALLCDVNIRQIYQNSNSEQPLKFTYLMPLPADCCLYDFTVVLDTEIVKTKVVDLSDERKLFTAAENESKTVVSASIDRSDRDLLTVKASNLKSQKFEISLSYLQKLKIATVRGKPCYQFLFQPALREKYMSPNNKNISRSPEAYAHRWKFQMVISSSSKTEFSEILYGRQKLGNDFWFEYEANSQYKRTIEYNGFGSLNADLSCHFRNSDAVMSALKYRISQSDAEYNLMLSLAMMPDEETSFELYSKSTSEYIFVVDCSYSMRGKAIQLAKTALLVAVKSLPPNSSFNIYKFGTLHTRVFYDSQTVNNESLQKVYGFIKSIDADMNGTEMLNPLLEIFQICSGRKNYKHTEILLFTDGEVADVLGLLKVVNEKNLTKCRISTLGIGEGFSRAVVDGLAQQTKGVSRYTIDEIYLPERVVELMTLSLEPYDTFYAIKFPFSKANTFVDVSQLITHPSELNFLFYSFPKSECADIKSFDLEMTRYHSATDRTESFVANIKLDLIDREGDRSLYRMKIYSEIAALQNKLLLLCDTESYLQIKTTIKKLSVENNILSNFTSFLCVSERKVNSTSENKEIVLPSVKYNAKKRCSRINECSDMQQEIVEESCTVHNESSSRRPMPTNFSKQSAEVGEEKNSKEEEQREDKQRDDKAKQSADLKNKSETLYVMIITMYNIAGFWENESEILLTCSEIFPDVNLRIQDSRQNKNAAIAKKLAGSEKATVVILTLLNIYFGDRANETSLIRRSAIRWLKSMKVDYLE